MEAPAQIHKRALESEPSPQSPRERLLANLRRPNIPGLSGLRGIAALSVVAFHGWSEHFPGRMAVQLFFVISGFLITWLLLREEQRSGRINRKAFYIRRAFRLLPALFALLAWEWFADFPRTVKPAIIAAGFYFANYRLIFGGHMVALMHTWSLAIEEHFYLIWPQIFVIAGNRRFLSYACFVAAISEFVWRFASADFVSPGYAALATETSSGGVLIGCGIALVLWYRPADLPAFTLRPLVGAFSLAMVLMLAQLPARLQDLCGVVAAIPFAAIIVLQAVTYAWRVLENPISRFLGQISYAIYLWSIVASALVRRLGHSGKHTLLFLFAIIIATISQYLIEKPAQSFARRWLAAAPKTPVKTHEIGLSAVGR